MKKRMCAVMWAVMAIAAVAGVSTAASVKAAQPESTEVSLPETEAAEQTTAEQTTAEEISNVQYISEVTTLLAEPTEGAEVLEELALNSEVTSLEPEEAVTAGEEEAEEEEKEPRYVKVSVQGKEGYVIETSLAAHPIRFTTENLTFREKADKESEKLTIVPLNKKVEVLELGDPEEEGGYSKILFRDMEGYVLTKYLTEDEQAALQAQKEADAYDKAKAAAKKSKKKSGSKKSSGGKKEVSREKYDDCDGSGHGYYEITYSDGSTKIVEY